MDGEMTTPRVSESKEAYWQRTLDEWKDSGLKACEFQRRKNLNKHAFIYWKLKLMGRGDGRQRLVAVRIRSTARGVAHPQGMRLRVGELFTVELPEGFDAQTLRQVLAVVREQVG
jgi:hypothetical protein